MIDVLEITRLLRQVGYAPINATDRMRIDFDTAITRLASDKGITIPDDLREWLKLSLGIQLKSGVLYGFNPSNPGIDIHRINELWQEWTSCGWIVVAADMFGNYYLIPTKGEFGEGFPVLFFDTIASMEEPAYIVASDIEHFVIAFIKEELGEERWPFDRDFVLEFDPHIVDFVTVRMPWHDQEDR